MVHVKMSAIRSRRHGFDAVKWILAVVFAALIFLPLCRMLSIMDADSIRKVVTSPSFGQAVAHSLTAAGLATLVTVLLSYLVALCVERIGLRARGVWNVLLLLPMLIPSISNGMGLVMLFGNNGLLTRLFHLPSGIYGLPGILLGSVLYAFPVAYLMFSDVMRYQDASPYEAAQVLGIGRFHQFTAITLPYLRKPLVSILFATFTLIVTDYGVPLMVGGKYITVPVVMYQEVIGQLDFRKGAVYGCFLLIPAILAFIIDVCQQDKGNTGFVTKAFEPSKNMRHRLLAYLLCGAVTLFLLLPVLSFVIMGFAADYPRDMTFTLANLTKALNLKAHVYLGHSLLMSLLVALIGVCLAFLTAYMTARMRSGASRFLHLAAITTAAIPGVVLGLSYVLTFKTSPLYGTLAILVMVNTVHFMSSPYLMMYNSLSKLNGNLEAVGETLGIRRSYMIRDVFLPLCRGTLLEMFAYFFVNCMITISAVSFLATTDNKPVSLMINQFEAQMQLECAAIVSLAILLANLGVKAVVRLCKAK